jgi:murein DD-endopeptidase MepM/ murein hydrolase activator NlpD
MRAKRCVYALPVVLLLSLLGPAGGAPAGAGVSPADTALAKTGPSLTDRAPGGAGPPPADTAPAKTGPSPADAAGTEAGVSPAAMTLAKTGPWLADTALTEAEPAPGDAAPSEAEPLPEDAASPNTQPAPGDAAPAEAGPPPAGAAPAKTGPPPADAAPGEAEPPPGPSPVGRTWPLPGGRPTVLRAWDPPPTPYARGHRGVDLAAPPHSPVLAVASGRVSFAGRVAGRGVVSVDLTGTGDPPLRTTYEPVRASVRKGDEVTAGQPLGTLEPTPSHCPATCLHWGLRRGKTYLDPLSLLPPWLLRPGPPVLLPVLGVPLPAKS